MLKTVLISVLLAVSGYTQQQTDLPWPTLANTDWRMIKTRSTVYKEDHHTKDHQIYPTSYLMDLKIDMEDGIFTLDL